jgi:hypothetical protein
MDCVASILLLLLRIKRLFSQKNLIAKLMQSIALKNYGLPAESLRTRPKKSLNQGVLMHKVSVNPMIRPFDNSNSVDYAAIVCKARRQ